MGKQLGIIAVVLLAAGFFFRAPLPVLIVRAEPIGISIGGFALTNTILATWLTMVVLVVLFRKATSNMQLVPSGLQNLIESLVEALYSFAVNVAGEKYARVFFPLIGSIFFFVLCNSWLSLLPGFGTIGVIEKSEHEAVAFTNVGGVGLLMPQAGIAPLVSPAPAKESHATAPAGVIEGTLAPLLRGANTDLNTTLALALVAMFFVEMWGIRFQGLGGYASKFINVAGFKDGPMMGVIYFAIGLIEFVSELARVISFTFRLFGNMFAGEVLLAVITFLVPWVLADIFYGLEVFVGAVQALVFAGLTLVFATSATAGHGDNHGQEHGHAAEGHL